MQTVYDETALASNAIAIVAGGSMMQIIVGVPEEQVREIARRLDNHIASWPGYAEAYRLQQERGTDMSDVPKPITSK